MEKLSPAQQAQYDRKLEEGLHLTLDIASNYEQLDSAEATRTMFMELVKVKAWRREELAMAVAALAVRLHRRGSP